MVERWFQSANPTAETNASHRVRVMILESNSWEISGMAGEPMRNRAMPPRRRANPDAALEPMVGFILLKMMMPMDPKRVDSRMRMAPRSGFVAPEPGEYTVMVTPMNPKVTAIH